MLKRSTRAAVAPSRGGWSSLALSCIILGLVLSDVSGCSPSASQSATAASVQTSSAPRVAALLILREDAQIFIPVRIDKTGK